MTFKLLLLILAFALSPVTTRGQDNYRPRKKDLSWGVEANGLRMAVWTNPATDKIFIAVRNFSTKKICYCEPEVNSFKVYARKDNVSPWLALGLKTGGIVVDICIVRTLKPNEEMPTYKFRYGVLKGRDYSFALDLREYSVPADWSGTVEVKIVQTNVYCIQDKPGRYKVSQVESPAVKIKLPFTEVAAPR